MLHKSNPNTRAVLDVLQFFAPQPPSQPYSGLSEDDFIELELLESQRLLEESVKKLEKNQQILRALEAEQAELRRAQRCLDAIGTRKPGEEEIAYAARIMASDPKFFDDFNPALGMIANIPDEGEAIDPALLKELRKKLSGEDAKIFEDGFLTREESIRLYGRVGNNDYSHIAVTPDQMKEVQKAYEEKLGIKITDDALLKGLVRIESVFRDSAKEAINEYLKQHPQPLEEACKPDPLPDSKLQQGIKP